MPQKFIIREGSIQRYMMWSRYSGNVKKNYTRGILGVRTGKNDMNIVRYLVNHRGTQDKDNMKECHPSYHPDMKYLCFNSNWKEPGFTNDSQIHPYMVRVPNAWYSPNNDGT